MECDGVVIWCVSGLLIRVIGNGERWFGCFVKWKWLLVFWENVEILWKGVVIWGFFLDVWGDFKWIGGCLVLCKDGGFCFIYFVGVLLKKKWGFMLLVVFDYCCFLFFDWVLGGLLISVIFLIFFLFVFVIEFIGLKGLLVVVWVVKFYDLCGFVWFNMFSVLVKNVDFFLWWWLSFLFKFFLIVKVLEIFVMFFKYNCFW